MALGCVTLVLLLLCVPLISTLCPDGCNCDGLRTYCSSGDLGHIPHFLNPGITTLRVTNDKIKKLQGSLRLYPNLVTLDLSHIQLAHLGRNPFMNQQHLQQLNLSHN